MTLLKLRDGNLYLNPEHITRVEGISSHDIPLIYRGGAACRVFLSDQSNHALFGQDADAVLNSPDKEVQPEAVNIECSGPATSELLNNQPAPEPEKQPAKRKQGSGKK